MILVTCGNGKIGQRVTSLLKDGEAVVKSASRSSNPAFDWNDAGTWDGALAGVTTVFIIFYPDLAVPGAAETVHRFTSLALEKGTERIVLFSGRGEEGAQEAEEAVKAIAPAWTVIRASWFNQNFSESFFLPSIQQGELSLPVGPVLEPFVDANDVAEVAAKVLLGEGHDGKTYELTGPRLLTFSEAVAEISRASEKSIRYSQITLQEFVSELLAMEVPSDFIELLVHLFTEVLDGRNASVTGDIETLLGRPAKDFADYAVQVASTNVWRAQ